MCHLTQGPFVTKRCYLFPRISASKRWVGKNQGNKGKSPGCRCYTLGSLVTDSYILVSQPVKPKFTTWPQMSLRNSDFLTLLNKICIKYLKKTRPFILNPRIYGSFLAEVLDELVSVFKDELDLYRILNEKKKWDWRKNMLHLSHQSNIQREKSKWLHFYM